MGSHSLLWGIFLILIFPGIEPRSPELQVDSLLFEPLGKYDNSVEFSCIRLFVTPWIAACQASLSITNSHSLLKLMFVKSVMPSSYLILCRPLLLLPSIFPSIRVFSNESSLHISKPKY